MLDVLRPDYASGAKSMPVCIRFVHNSIPMVVFTWQSSREAWLTVPAIFLLLYTCFARQPLRCRRRIKHGLQPLMSGHSITLSTKKEKIFGEEKKSRGNQLRYVGLKGLSSTILLAPATLLVETGSPKPFSSTNEKEPTQSTLRKIGWSDEI